ncbi:MAG: DNA repair protein RecO [Coxiellaceae bacterium]|nr:DNA repair protein RecO [Coxiellaceae bacterium]
MERVNLEPLFILHTRPYSNTSLILDVLTQNHGRLSIMARSARGLKSRYKGMLQPFSPLLASWTGNREMKNLGNVERQGPIHYLNGKALVCGFYLNELLQRLLQREDPHPEIFTLYQNTLTTLENKKDLQIALRHFEKQLLQSLGYALPLERDADHREAIMPDAFYQFLPDRGFIRCEENPDNHFIFSGKTLLALSSDNFNTEDTLKESKRLLRIVLNRHLGNRPIKSRELLK